MSSPVVILKAFVLLLALILVALGVQTGGQLGGRTMRITCPSRLPKAEIA